MNEESFRYKRVIKHQNTWSQWYEAIKVLDMASLLILALAQACVPAIPAFAPALVPTLAQAFEPAIPFALTFPALPPSSCRISPGIV